MKSYDARLLLLHMTQRRHGVPISNQPGQEVPDSDKIEALVLAQRAELDRKALKAA
jgi:hypothetical protein